LTKRVQSLFCFYCFIFILYCNLKILAVIKILNYDITALFRSNIFFIKMYGKETPNYPNIIWKNDKHTFYYKIIKAGTYPGEHILCQTKRPHSYPIPHGYVIQTTWNRNKCTVQCSINYIDEDRK